MDDTINQIRQRQCPWILYIENDCDGVRIFRPMLIVGATLYGILSILLLNYYIFNTIKQNEKIYRITSWTSLHYMKLCLFIFFIVRFLHSIIVVLNLFGGNIVFRDSFFLISWIPGHIFVYIHIANIFRILPSLLFNQFTSSTPKVKTIWMPKGEKQITIIFWIFCITTVLSLTISSISAAYIRAREGFTKRWFFTYSTHVFFQWLFSLVNGFIFLYYGRILVKQTRKSIKLIDTNNKEKENFREFVRKMKLYNFVFSAIYFFNAIIVLPSAILLVYLGLVSVVDMSFCAAVNIIFPILFGMLFYSIIKSETRKNVNLDEPNFTQQLSTYLQTNSSFSCNCMT